MMLVFLSIVSFIFFLVHLFVYGSVLYFFRITDSALKNWLAGTFIFLSLFFVLSSVLIHTMDNVWSRGTYLLASIWIGALVYVFIFFLFGWLIIGLTKTTPLTVNTVLLGKVIIGITFIITLAGLYNGRVLKKTYLEITIPNLPEYWSGKKIVQITDTHLGPIWSAKLMEKIATMANEEKPEMIVITGDYFDGPTPKMDEYAAPLKNLRAPAGIYFVTGNHETYAGADKAETALQKVGVNVLSDKVVISNGLQLAGVNYRGRGEAPNLELVFTQLKNNLPTIMLYHEPVFIDQFKKNNINLLLTGHTHHGQLWPFNYITSAIYKGYDYGFFKDGDFNHYASVGAGTWGPPMRTNSQSEITIITLK